MSAGIGFHAAKRAVTQPQAALRGGISAIPGQLSWEYLPIQSHISQQSRDIPILKSDHWKLAGKTGIAPSAFMLFIFVVFRREKRYFSLPGQQMHLEFINLHVLSSS